jgi:hypothetical protein
MMAVAIELASDSTGSSPSRESGSEAAEGVQDGSIGHREVPGD